ncbi:MAG: hypothetical protein ACXVBU_03590, partial [Ktedonobacteraceae bacterium]
RTVCSSALGVGGASLPPSSARDPPGCCLLGGAPHRLDPCHAGSCGCRSLEPQTPEKSLLPASDLDESGIEQTQQHRTLRMAVSFSSFISNGLHSVAGRPLHDRWRRPTLPPSSSLWLPNRLAVLISFVLLNVS